MGQIILNDCTVTVQNQTNTHEGSSAPAKTHDISGQIPLNPNLEFDISPRPSSIDSLIVVLDGLVLRLSPDGVDGDYTYNQATAVLTLLVDHIEDDSVLLAIYQE